MRCDRMHATISVKQCKANQNYRVSEGLFRRPTHDLRYPGCRDCPTGERAARGELNDDDLKALLDAYHARVNPPADVVTEALRRQESGARNDPETNQTKEEAQMREEEQPTKNAELKKEEKICTKCKKPKPIERFSRVRKGEQKRKPICVDCETAYQRDRKARIRAAAERVKSEQQNSRISNIQPQKDEAEQLLTPHPQKRQAEPTPTKETTAPACPQNEDWILENQILLDFSCYPEVLEEIKHLADWEERPVEVQARLMLRRLLRPGTTERMQANRSGDRYQPMFFDAHGNQFIDGEPESKQCA